MQKSEKYLTPIHLFFELWTFLSSINKKNFFWYIALIVLNSVFEIIAISSVIPFLGALTDPEKLTNIELISVVFRALDIKNINEIVLSLTLLFCLAAVISMLTKLLVIHFGTKLAFNIGGELAYKILNCVLYQKYIFHVNNNSSAIIDVVLTKTNAAIGGFLIQIINLLSTGILLFFILAALFAINPLISTVIFIGFGALYFVILISLRKIITKNGESISQLSGNIVKVVQESIGGIRNVLMDGTQEFFLKKFKICDSELRRSQSSNIIIQSSPRPIIEAIGVIVIVSIAYLFAANDGLEYGIIPTLGGYAFGIQKILPLLQQSYGSIASILGTAPMVSDVLGYIKLPITHSVECDSNAEINFKDAIVFSNVSFRYCDSLPWVFKDLNLSIPRGSRIGIVGQTGKGKSTFLNLIMGLLSPTSGQVYLDGKNINFESRHWRKIISHVPQSIYLADTTISENIAFGVPKSEIDYSKIVIACQQAKISNVIESWTESYETRVGEQGIRLSGGQKQRIGIARALYRDAKILILDEGTNALDGLTEESVMETIYGMSPNLTILIVSHNTESLKQCTKIIDLSTGKIRIN
jgi:ATP-binding cassette subfamily B protein